MTYQRINFAKNWNNKLLCEVFTTIRPLSKKHSIEETFDIRIDEQFFCYAKVVQTEIKTLRDIVNSGYHLTDTGMDEKDFLEFMSKMYSKKSWWIGEDTAMKLIFLKKITQLTIFEDGKYGVNN